MSFLFHKRTRKIAGIVWGFIAVIVAIGMVLAFAPGLTNLLLG